VIEKGQLKSELKTEMESSRKFRLSSLVKTGFSTQSRTRLSAFPSGKCLKIHKRTETGEFKETQSLNVDGTEIRRFKMDGENLTISTNQTSIIYRKGQDGLFKSASGSMDFI